MRRVLSTLLSATLLTVLAGCPGGLPQKPDTPDKPDVPDTPDTPDRGGDEVQPNRCGDYASTDIGKKIKLFLETAVALDKAVTEAHDHVKLACVDMGKELSMAAGKLEGDTKTVCNAVAEQLKANLKAGLKAEAQLDITYEPAKCTVDASVQASAEASCAGSGSTGTGGSEASGACASSAQMEAALEAKCEPAVVTVDYGAEVVVDKAKLEAAASAIRVGLPKIANVYGRLVVLKDAAEAFVKASADLARAGKSILQDLGDQVLCVAGQVALAANLVAEAFASVEVTVSVSVEVSASAGAEM